MGRPSDHFCDSGPEHHADENGRHSQDDDGPQLADQGFLLQGLQYRYFPPFFLLGFTISVTVCSYIVNRLRTFAQNFFGCYFLKPVIYDAQNRPFRFDPEGAFSAIQFAIKLLADYSSAKYLMVRTI